MAQNPNLSNMNAQQRVYLIQMIKEQMEIFQSQLGLLQTNKEGIEVTLNTLKGLKKEAKPDHEVIVSLGPNAYTKARLVDPNKVMVFIKDDIILTKSLDDGIKSLTKMMEENQRVQQRIVGRIQELQQQLNQLQNPGVASGPKVDIEM